LALFYSKDRQELIEKYFPLTKDNFVKMQFVLMEKPGRQVTMP
jgi:hypothetical protein